MSTDEAEDENWIVALLHWLSQPGDAPLSDKFQAALRAADALELESFVGVFSAQADSASPGGRRALVVMQLVAARVAALYRETQVDAADPLVSPHAVAQLYLTLASTSPPAAAHALQILAVQGDEESLDMLTELLSDSPPADWQSTGVALNALWHARPEVLESFFEKLGDGFVQPGTMAVLLDLANFAVRSKRLATHPWSARHASLAGLLGNVVHRLSELERAPSKFGNSVEEVHAALGESLALTVSLCDALGWIGQPEAGEELRKVLGLSHRRVQTEAAAALARLGDEAGRTRLIELASDRVARLRAVAYADELGFAEDIDAELRFPQALAESELAAWLASPEQFGVPPSDMELVDSRSQYWPSYEEPRDCFLFRYAYAMEAGQFSNIGIAGPCAHAFQADLANLPVDDIYAAFAGWHAEHDEIYELPPNQWNAAQRREAERLVEFLEEQQLADVGVEALTFFLGELAIAGRATQAGKPLCVVSDGFETLCYPTHAGPSSMTLDVALCIFRGRKLLRTFNA